MLTIGVVAGLFMGALLFAAIIVALSDLLEDSE
jgi:hypothetical protein